MLELIKKDGEGCDNEEGYGFTPRGHNREGPNNFLRYEKLLL